MSATLMDRIRGHIVEHESAQPSPYSEPASQSKPANSNRPALAVSSIESLWGPVNEADLLTVPLPRRWLLRRPTKNGEPCDPAFGDGMLPLGKAGMLVADGGVGKTNAVLELAVCVTIGRDWLGYFPIGDDAIGKRVLLVLAEEDEEEVKRRLFTIARGLQLSPGECAAVASRMVALPLSGKPTALVAPGLDRRVTETPELGTIRRKLAEDAGDGWGLVVLDPLARMAEGEIETSNDGATRAVQAIESLCSAPGRPTVLVVHHSSQDGVHRGEPSARGVTAIRNGFRWEATLAATDDGDVMFRQTKSNYSAPMAKPGLRLIREDGGLLRVATDDVLQERETEQHGRRDAALDRNVERLVAALALRGPAVSKAQIIEWAKLGSKPGRLAFDESVSRGLIVNQGTAREPRLCVCKSPVPPESASPRDGGPATQGAGGLVRGESVRVRESAKHWTEDEAS